MKNLAFYIAAVLLLWLVACSSESNSWSSKAFHNTTAHYNAYYYALDEITKIEQTIRKSQQDDYNNILPLFPRLDSVLAETYDKETQEAVKMASLAIQRHPNSKWVDDSYILVGKARLYSLDWGNAIQTFKYVNTKSEDPNARHRAIILLARTFTEHGEYNNTEAAFDFLEKEKLNKTNLKDFYLEKAHYYQVRENYDKFVQNLTAVTPLLKRKDKPGRIYFILGQVYQKLGFESEAYNFFRECIETHPDYEVDFYARLYMAQVAEISKSKNIANARKSFKILLKDSKNKEFKDKIYYEMGVFERKQKNINEAITNYNLAIREGSNKLIDGEAYLRLGEIYYDTLKNYEAAKAYYDSAVASLNKNYDDYEAIKLRQEILDEFVKNLKVIEWQDSLISMAEMDSATLWNYIKQSVESKEVKLASGKKKKRGRVSISQVSSSIVTPSGIEGTDWYFGNPSAMALGQQEFNRLWGSIPLEDNWRRSSKAIPVTARVNPITTPTTSLPADEPVAAVIETDPVEEAFNRINNEIPRNEEAMDIALSKIEEAYFNLGDIYYFKLDEKENAILYYEKLLNRFPETDHKPEVLYKLYLMYKESDPNKSENYVQQLKTNFPEHILTKILINPDYLVESGLVLEKQKVMYKSAYGLYENGRYPESLVIINSALELERTAFYPNMEMLKILIAGKTEPIARYQYQLDEFIKNYPDSDLTEYAKKLLTASREVELRLEKETGIRYSKASQSAHYFVLVSPADAKLENVITKLLTTFNQNFFREHNLNVSTLILNGSYSINLVSDLPEGKSAMEYYQKFKEQQSTFTEIRSHKFDTFVITKDNFDIFYRTKGLNEYLQFFEKNYRQENP